MVLYLVNNYCTFKSRWNFTLHTCKADFLMLFERGLHWGGSWSAMQGSGLKLHMNLRMQMRSQGVSAGTGACLQEGVASNWNAFHVHGFFALNIILVQREEKESLKFTVKPLCFMPLSQLTLRMKEHISNQAKNTFGKKGRWKISESLF